MTEKIITRDSAAFKELRRDIVKAIRTPFTGRISAALSYSVVPAVYKARTADKESFHQE